MIIAGQILNGFRQLITQAGERISTEAKPKKIYTGIPLDKFSAKRLWVDEVLTDAERILFIKNAFSDIQFYSVDYEIINRDVGREFLHAYALHENNFLKKSTAVETVLHGLGRALFQLYEHGRVYQCVSVFDEAIVLSVHQDQCVYFFIKEPFKKNDNAIYAARRAMECYYASNPIDIDQCFFINNTQNKVLDIYAKIDFDVPLTVMDKLSAQWLIAYGLACRGLGDD